MFYSYPTRQSVKALDTATPVLLYTSAIPDGRKGWRVWNPSPSVSIVIAVVTRGGTAPTAAEMLAGQAEYQVAPKASASDAGANVDVYAIVTSGTLNVYPQVIF